MSEISLETGKRIRHFRTARGMTLDGLAAAIYKSRATVSKYEKGEIPVLGDPGVLLTEGSRGAVPGVGEHLDPLLLRFA